MNDLAVALWAWIGPAGRAPSGRSRRSRTPSLCILACTILSGPGAGARAADLAPPSGEVLLTISGRIEHTNREGVAAFDRPMLENLGLIELRTWTPWTMGQPMFQGVLAQTLMEAVGAQGAAVHARALNDYEVTIPLSDFRDYRVLVAMYQDGRALTMRERGPLWIVYPWSDHPELDDRPTRQKSIWQLVHLRID